MRAIAAFLLALGTVGAQAQTVPRIKATVVSFDGKMLNVMPEGDTAPMAIGVRPATRILREEKTTLADIKAGDFIGATVQKAADGTLRADEVHIFPDALRGSGEGLYPAAPASPRLIVNGTVGAVAAGVLTVAFHGAAGAAGDCSGRAPLPDALGRRAGCQGTARIQVTAAAPVIVLAVGDKSLLVPGAVLALSLMAGPDGRPVTPGLTVESVAIPAPAAEAPSKRMKRP